jgi:hypothetical protein
MSFVIGCVGRARHGKGSTAEIIQAWAMTKGIQSQAIALADPLKDFLTAVVGRSEPFRGTPAQRNEPVNELPWSSLGLQLRCEARTYWPGQDFDIAPSGRQLMQLFGTEVIRKHFYADSWVRIAGSRAKAFNGITIIDDMRFPNEAVLRTSGGINDMIVKIVRPDIPNLNHPSEDAVDTIELALFNKILTNDGNLLSLFNRVTLWLDETLVVGGGTVSLK